MKAISRGIAFSIGAGSAAAGFVLLADWSHSPRITEACKPIWEIIYLVVFFFGGNPHHVPAWGMEAALWSILCLGSAMAYAMGVVLKAMIKGRK